MITIAADWKNANFCPKSAKNAAERPYKTISHFCTLFVQAEALIFNCQYPHNIFSPSKSGFRRVLSRYSKWGADIQNSGYIIRAAALKASSNELMIP
jgi:hypothetical protein